MTGNANLAMWKDTNNPLLVTLTDSTGSPVNLSGATIQFTASTTYGTTPVISKSVTNHTYPTSGISTVTLTGSDTNISPGNYIYDMQYTDSSGNKNIFLEGQLVIKPKLSI